jgi:hypothetical protein
MTSRFRRRAFALLAILSLPALAAACCCGLVGPSGQEELRQAKQRWEANEPPAYELTVSYACYCGGPVARQVRVVVQDGEPVDYEYVDDPSEPVEVDAIDHIDTVEELFDRVEYALDEDAHKLDVDYDSELGYPRSIAIDYKTTTADDEVSYSAEVAPRLQAVER